MKILLSGRDLADLAWRAEPFDLTVFHQYLRTGGHEIVLSYADLRSLICPVNQSDFLRVKPMLESLGRLPQVFLDIVVRLEIQAAIDACLSDCPYQSCNVFLNSLRGHGLPLVEAAWSAICERPKVFETAFLEREIQSERAGFADLELRRRLHAEQPDSFRDPDNRSVPAKHKLGIEFENKAKVHGLFEAYQPVHFKTFYIKDGWIQSKFHDWLFENPDCCPGFQLGYETETALLAKCSDLAAPDSDLQHLALDRFHVLALPYCDAATFGGPMLDSCLVGGKALAARGAKLSVEKKIFSNLATLVAENP